ncbi:EH signature domain-containing protein [Erythrobacter sp. EC-HK427]|uniref:EH signature domain-containing protein n=1 Tax=Erythrobacter sp. EC-HK427 TaxID=2038396 RepID=UPI00125F10B1|nr:EH signature domain-containing protein [Erythrobacter sp. EC-HK427]
MEALASAGLAKPPTTQPELQRQLAKLDSSVGEAEPIVELKPFLRKAATNGAAGLPRFQLNRVLRGVWCDDEFDDLGAAALARADGDHRRSSDQAVIDGYLTYFPTGRSIMPMLAEAASRAASRHDWAWRERGARWDLFKPHLGPANVAREFVARDADGIASLMRETGLGANLAASGFGQATFAETCKATAELQPAEAVGPQRSILRMFDTEAQAGQLELVVRALLEPWISTKPEPEHRKAISEFLLIQVGDPRFQLKSNRWEQIVASLAESFGKERAREVTQVFKRWLTEVAMREFFRAIAKTTDRPDQWKQREAFWIAYLDEGLVTDAWPALGSRAKHQIDSLIRQSGERPEYGQIRGGPSQSSSIIMQIGDLRISEWSDNGSCRFWSDTDPGAPKLYAKVYDGGKLRTTSGRSDFEYESHVPASPGWEGKFAGIIHRRTSIAHPRHGRGRGRNWNDRW